MKDIETLADFDQYRTLASSLAAPARIPVEVRTAVVDPYDAYRRVRTRPAASSSKRPADATVEVTDYRRIDSYSEVMHTVSAVEGTRRDDASVADAIAAVFPGGTITGAPEPRTMEIIDEVEATLDKGRALVTAVDEALGLDANLALSIREKEGEEKKEEKEEEADGVRR